MEIACSWLEALGNGLVVQKQDFLDARINTPLLLDNILDPPTLYVRCQISHSFAENERQKGYYDHWLGSKSTLRTLPAAVISFVMYHSYERPSDMLQSWFVKPISFFLPILPGIVKREGMIYSNALVLHASLIPKTRYG